MSNARVEENKASCSDNKVGSPPHATVLLTPPVLDAYRSLAHAGPILEYELDTQPIGGVGENSYGDVCQVLLKPTRTLPTLVAVPPMRTILKTAPRNAARRNFMHVVDFYKREVHMYELVFREFYALQAELQATGVEVAPFEAVPRLLHASLQPEAEFLIFEDLMQCNYTPYKRSVMPTYEVVVCTFKAIAQLHAMSFVLQALKPGVFQALIRNMGDNLFTHDMAEVSVEFGKKYVERTRHMLEEEQRQEKRSKAAELEQMLRRIEDNFKGISIEAVRGEKSAPYAVICHGDFWNNNVLYQYDSQGVPVKAKLVDFQMSRYASPVTDLMRYLYCCTEQDLRTQHFDDFLKIYHNTLAQIIRTHGLSIEDIYPETIFHQQLRDLGYFGLCMAAFSLPYFISNNTEWPDLDKVSEAVQELSSSSDTSDVEDEQSPNKRQSLEKTSRDLVDECEMLNERTMPIFKRRMLDIVEDMQKYQMIEAVLKFNKGN